MSEMANKIKQWMEEHTQQGVEFLQELIQAPSTEGHEEEAQKVIMCKMEELGLDIDVWEPDGETLSKHPYFASPRSQFKGSPNVVGVWKGTGQGKSMILNSHIDVVPAGDLHQWDHSPWSGVVEGNRIYGRGSTDMKGGTVSNFLAVQCLKELGIPLKGDVIIQSVIAEESGGLGTLAAIERGPRADAAIIPEPTNMKFFPKQQGSMWFRIKIKGRAAHGGTRYEGVSALEKTMHVVQAIQQLEKKRNERMDDPLYEGVPIPVPINIGVVQGGEWPSSVPDLVKLEGRMGVAPEETMEHARAELENSLKELANQDEWLKEHPPEVEWFGARWVPNSLEVEHQLVNTFSDAYKQVRDEAPIFQAAPWGTDAGLLSVVGDIPTLVFGPGVTEVAHFPNEYMEIDKMIQAAEIIALALVDWCTQGALTLR